MDTKLVLKKQYHAALTMLKQTIERCPDELWTVGEQNRPYWRIAYHVLFYTRLYLQNEEKDFVRWELDIEHVSGFDPLPEEFVPYTKEQVLEYWAKCDGIVDEQIDNMDLEADTCGFWWYKMPKLDHQIMNIRHIQQHTGQLSELLMARGVDTDWIGTVEKQ